MKISINDVMNNAFVISIDDDRYQLFTKLLCKQSINIFPKKIIGNTDQKYLSPIKRCQLSHISVVKLAKSRNLPYVFIFEDDAYPCDSILNKSSKYFDNIPDDAGLCLFGWSAHTRSKTQAFNKLFNRITTTSISGAHSYMLTQKCYDKYLKYFADHPNGKADNEIFFEMKPSYVIDYPLFIQYAAKKSMNGHIGYIYYGDHTEPPKGFSKVLI